MQCMASSTLSALGFTLAQRLIAELWSNLHQVPTRTHERAGSRKVTHARARTHTHCSPSMPWSVSLTHLHAVFALAAHGAELLQHQLEEIQLRVGVMLALHLGEISALVLDVIFQTLQPPALSSPAVTQGDAHRRAVSHTCAGMAAQTTRNHNVYTSSFKLASLLAKP